jgi:hypothetical protein
MCCSLLGRYLLLKRKKLSFHCVRLKILAEEAAIALQLLMV